MRQELARPPAAVASRSASSPDAVPEDPLRVALVTFQLGEYSIRLANALAAGCDVTLFIADTTAGWEPIDADERVRLRVFRHPRLRQPVPQLRRCRALLADGGSVLLELEAGAALWCGTAYLETTETADTSADPLTVLDPFVDGGPWFPWAVLGPHAVDDVAAEAGLVVVARAEGERCFVELVPA